MQREREASHFGQYVAGVLDALDVPRKAVCDRTRIHPSTLSRKINGLDAFREAEVFAIGQAVGEITSTRHGR